MDTGSLQLIKRLMTLGEDKQSVVKSDYNQVKDGVIETDSDKLIAFAESGDLKNQQWLKVGT